MWTISKFGSQLRAEEVFRWKPFAGEILGHHPEYRDAEGTMKRSFLLESDFAQGMLPRTYCTVPSRAMSGLQ